MKKRNMNIGDALVGMKRRGSQLRRQNMMPDGVAQQVTILQSWGGGVGFVYAIIRECVY